MKNPLFYAKILLFGEYGIIENSKGLTLPFSFYKGSLKYNIDPHSTQQESQNHLKNYYQYLTSLDVPTKYALDLGKFSQDLEQGMYFDSNIPQGYGVGSSGALVAAIYDKYSLNKISPEEVRKEEISELKHVFGLMESYFHGKSSGIDPLICYMNIPLLINSRDNIDKIGIPEYNSGKGAIFLIDSGIQGDTEPMVQLFFEKLKQSGFRKILKEEFIKYNDACIEAFLNKDFTPLFDNLKALSAWALVHLQPMIPTGLLKAWEQGIQTNAYYLKLCGSGGGGYILGFTQDYETTDKMLPHFKKEVIFRF